MNTRLHRQVSAIFLVIIFALAINGCQRVYWVKVIDSPGAMFNVLPAVEGGTGSMTSSPELSFSASGMESLISDMDSQYKGNPWVPVEAKLDSSKSSFKDKIKMALKRLAESSLSQNDKKFWSLALKNMMKQGNGVQRGGGSIYILKMDSGYNTRPGDEPGRAK